MFYRYMQPTYLSYQNIFLTQIQAEYATQIAQHIEKYDLIIKNLNFPDPFHIIIFFIIPCMRINIIIIYFEIFHENEEIILINPYHADPCSSYTLISGQYKRSVAYTIKSTDIAVSDNFLSEGWYRFDSGAGNDMATQAPTVTQCGTIYPIWMNGMCHE